MKDLAAVGVVASDLGASARMHEKDAAVRQAQLDGGGGSSTSRMRWV
jgi:hypothetical protein